MGPLVSVVVPSYNRTYCVSDTVRSVLSQSYSNVEVLVVDDGSSDNTADVIGKNFAQDTRVRYVRQSNQGVSAARNHGMRLAQGKYVGLLDSDDIFLAWKLELQIACMERFIELVMTWSDKEALAPDGTSIAPRYLRHMYYAYRAFDGNPPFEHSLPLAEIVPTLADTVGAERLYKGDLFGPMMMGNLVHTSTTVLRKSAQSGIGEFDTQFHHGGEDFDFHLRTCREGQAYRPFATEPPPKIPSPTKETTSMLRVRFCTCSPRPWLAIGLALACRQNAQRFVRQRAQLDSRGMSTP